MRMFEVIVSKRFKKWVRGLRDVKGKAVIVQRIDRLERGDFGERKSVGEGVWELRLFVGPGYRIYYALYENKVVLLLIGGDKSTQDRDIKTAKSIKRDWERATEVGDEKNGRF